MSARNWLCSHVAAEKLLLVATTRRQKQAYFPTRPENMAMNLDRSEDEDAFRSFELKNRSEGIVKLEEYLSFICRNILSH